MWELEGLSAPRGSQGPSTNPRESGELKPLLPLSADAPSPLPPTSGTTACSWWTRWHLWVGSPSTWTSKVRVCPPHQPTSGL